MPSYTFDVRFFAAIKVDAPSEDEARDLLALVDGADCNAGSWPNGNPILFEAFVDDDWPSLTEED